MSEDFEEVSVQSRGFGILDIGYRSQVFFDEFHVFYDLQRIMGK